MFNICAVDRNAFGCIVWCQIHVQCAESNNEHWLCCELVTSMLRTPSSHLDTAGFITIFGLPQPRCNPQVQHAVSHSVPRNPVLDATLGHRLQKSEVAYSMWHGCSGSGSGAAASARVTTLSVAQPGTTEPVGIAPKTLLIKPLGATIQPLSAPLELTPPM